MKKTTLITGASSGIGKALALELSRRGHHLGLASRRIEELERLGAEVRAAAPGTRVEVRALDVTRTETVAETIEAFASALGPIDIVVVNAGVGSSAGHKAIIETNVLGAMATIDAAVSLFKRQGKGQVVVVSSVAAARGLPGAGAYSASKAAITVYADAVRAELRHTPVCVTTLFPGYIDTPMNQDVKNRPFLISVEKGASLMADLIERQVQSAAVPKMPWSVLMPFIRWAPAGVLPRRAAPVD